MNKLLISYNNWKARKGKCDGKEMEENFHKQLKQELSDRTGLVVIDPEVTGITDNDGAIILSTQFTTPGRDATHYGVLMYRKHWKYKAYVPHGVKE